MHSQVTLSSSASASQPRWAARLRYGVPIVAFMALALKLGWALNRDPSIVPSALIGKSVPQFTLPPVKGRALALSSVDLKREVSLVNVFASWCV